MTVFLKLRPDSVFYVLHVDGVGEYAMRNADGTRCLFLFTTEQSVSRFVELMELPKQKSFTAMSFDLKQIAEMLLSVLDHTQAIAIDPVADCEFTPVRITDFLHALGVNT